MSVLLLPFLALALVSGVAAPVDAHSTSKVISTKNSSRFHQGFYQQGSAGGVMSVSESSTRSVGVSGTLGVSKEIVEASLGFSLSDTITLTWNSSRSTPDRAYCYGIVLYRRVQTKTLETLRHRRRGHTKLNPKVTRATGTAITTPTRRMSNGGDRWCG